MTSPLRVGVLGAGVISDQYLATTTASEDLRVVAIAARSEPRRTAQAALYGIESLTVDELLARDDIDLIVNLTPPAAHFETNLRIIEAGKHLWSEKPLAMSAADAARVLEVAESHGVLVGVAPDTYLGPAHQRALRALEDDEIGTPRTALAMVQYWGPDVWHPNPEFLFDRGAGPVQDMGVYWITLLLLAFGRVRSVTADARTSRTTRTVMSGPRAGATFEPRVPTYVAASIDFAGGGHAVCIFSFESAIKDFSLTINGDAGAIRFADPNGFEGSPARVVKGESESLEVFESTGAGRGLGVIEMARALAEGARGRVDPRIGLDALRVMEAIEASAVDGRRVFVQEV